MIALFVIGSVASFVGILILFNKMKDVRFLDLPKSGISEDLKRDKFLNIKRIEKYECLL
jgi:hypothetical protein